MQEILEQGGSTMATGPGERGAEDDRYPVDMEALEEEEMEEEELEEEEMEEEEIEEEELEEEEIEEEELEEEQMKEEEMGGGGMGGMNGDGVGMGGMGGMDGHGIGMPPVVGGGNMLGDAPVDTPEPTQVRTAHLHSLFYACVLRRFCWFLAVLCCVAPEHDSDSYTPSAVVCMSLHHACRTLRHSTHCVEPRPAIPLPARPTPRTDSQHAECASPAGPYLRRRRRSQHRV